MQTKISLAPSMVQEFVNITTKCDFDIDIAGNNRFFVDGKSILGILGLDLSRPLTVSYEGFNPELEKFLRLRALAC